MKFKLLMISIAVHVSCYADCTDVISQSKTVSIVVQDQAWFEANAKLFCSEYSSAKSNGKSMSAEGSYGVISASFGQSSSSAEQLANKLCDSANSTLSRSDAYRQYVETISPSAYSAYEMCKQLEASGILIEIPPNAVLENWLSAKVSNKATDTNGQLIDIVVSPGINCSWKDGTNSTRKLRPNETDYLTCARTDSSKPGSVNIFSKSKLSAELNYAWREYQNSLPVDRLASLTQSTSALLTSLNNAVVGFNRTTCPEGWRPYTPAAGVFLRGIGSTDPDGIRAPGSLQTSMIEAHHHERPHDVFDAGTIRTGATRAGSDYGYTYSGADGVSAPPTSATGGVETRPRNAAVLFCTRG